MVRHKGPPKKPPNRQDMMGKVVKLKKTGILQRAPGTFGVGHVGGKSFFFMKKERKSANGMDIKLKS